MRPLPSSSEQLRMHGEISWRALEIEVISEPSIRIDLPIVATMLDPEDWKGSFLRFMPGIRAWLSLTLFNSLQ